MGQRFETAKQVTLIGADALTSLGGMLDEQHLSRLFLISSPRAARSAVAGRFRRQFGDRVVGSFDAVQPHANRADVQAMVIEAAKVLPDAFVAVGGGSSIDSAKAASLHLAQIERKGDACDDTLPRSLRSVVAVPTTLSGAEYTAWGAVLDDGRKVGFPTTGVTEAALIVVYDTAAFADVPIDVLRTTGMNALAHCVESAYSLETNLVTQALAEEGTRLLGNGLLAVHEGDVDNDTLSDLMVGAVLGGICLSTGGACIHHGICHALGTVFGIPHGESNSAVLPYAVEFNAAFSIDAQIKMASALGHVLDEKAVRHSTALADELAALQPAIGVAVSLKEIGAERDRLPDVAREAFASPTVRRNPRPISGPDELLPILERAFAGALQQTG